MSRQPSFIVLLRWFLSRLRAENVRFEVVDVTGIVKYIRTKMFFSFFAFFFSPKCFFGGKGGGYFSSHKDANDLVSILNNELAKIVICLKVNKLSLNLTKTNFMIFMIHPRQKKVNANFPLSLENTVIRQVTETKILGVLMDQHLSWGAFHLGKKPGNFGGSKSGISDW